MTLAEEDFKMAIINMFKNIVTYMNILSGEMEDIFKQNL